MADHDEGRRGSAESLPVSGRAEGGDQPGGGKQSLVEKEFGAAVGPGPWVQRRVDNAAVLSGKQSLVEQTFGAAARSGAPVQQRGAGGAASAARAGTQASVDAAVAQGVAAPASLAWQPITIHEQFGRRDDVSNVQARTGPEAAPAGADVGEPESVHAAAAQGVATPASPLPHRTTIQELFGPRHDVSTVQAHTGPKAAASARAMGAHAYATGNHVVLGGQTDLHTVAHEAAHVVQQRGGVQLKGGVGAAGDAYEQHADAVADRVVAGESAASLLDQMSGDGHTSGAVQRASGMPGPSEGAPPGTPQSDPVALSRLQALLTHAGLSVEQQQLPTATLTPADATRILNRLLQSNSALVGIGPRMVAVRLMQDVVAGGAPESVAAVVQRLGAFAPIIILRPDGYVARAVTGEAIQRAGKANNARESGIEQPEKATGKGSKVDLDAVRNRPAHELISGSLKKSPSYATELADHTVGELVDLQQTGGATGVKAGKMLKLIKDAERLRGKAK